MVMINNIKSVISNYEHSSSMLWLLIMSAWLQVLFYDNIELKVRNLVLGEVILICYLLIKVQGRDLCLLKQYGIPITSLFRWRAKERIDVLPWWTVTTTLLSQLNVSYLVTVFFSYRYTIVFLWWWDFINDIVRRILFKF